MTGKRGLQSHSFGYGEAIDWLIAQPLLLGVEGAARGEEVGDATRGHTA
jgi:hypothetical protein